MDGCDNGELIAEIRPDVMQCLHRSHFFEKLDDLLCPATQRSKASACGGNYKLSGKILQESGFEEADLSEIFSVLQSVGGYCDCEILYNVAESSRLKSVYWQNQAKQERHHSTNP